MRKGKRRRRSDGGGNGGGDEGGCPRVLSNWNTTSGNPRRPLNGQRKRVCTTVEEATAGSLAQPHTDAVFSNAARLDKRALRGSPRSRRVGRTLFIVLPRRFMIIQRETSRVDDIGNSGGVSRAYCEQFAVPAVVSRARTPHCWRAE